MGGQLDPVLAAARNAVRSTVKQTRFDRFVVALSGGADSLALTAAAAFVANREGWDLEAIVVDHQLQPGSAAVTQRAVEQAVLLGVPARAIAVAVGEAGGMEAAARTARRTALQAAAGSDRGILLGHTLDDQAETVLLGLGRGSGPRSIAGMPVIDEPWIRPLLGMRRNHTEQICSRLGLSYWSDPHNEDDRFRRVRIRRELLPLMEDILGGGVAEALARTAEQLRLDNTDLDQQAAEILHGLARGGEPDELNVIAELRKLSPALRRRCLRLLALRAGANAGELSAQHIANLDRLVNEPGKARQIDLPGGVRAVRDRNRLQFVVTPVAI